MIDNFPPIVKLPFIVPDQVINSIININNTCELIGQNNKIMNTFYGGSGTYKNIHYLQRPSDEQISKFKFKNVNGEDSSKVEYFGLSTTWMIENEDIKILKEFIYSYSDSAFGARITTLRSNGMIEDHNPHNKPRLFIPVTNSNCEYMIIKKCIKTKMFFEVGNCYIFDVRNPHFVYNRINEERIVAIFMFDPKKETKLSLN